MPPSDPAIDSAGSARPPRAGAVAALAALLVAATVAAYAGVAGHDFVNYDDDVYVWENPRVLDGLSGAGVRWAFGRTYAANWHPLTWLSHMLDVELFGLDAGAHHLVSLALHAASAVLLLLFLVRATGTTWPSAIVAGLFALHPLRVESVAWVAERKDVLAGLFWMAALVAHERRARGGGAAALGAVLAAMALSLLAKPMAVTLPFVLLLLDRWPLGRFGRVPVRALLLEKLPLFALSAVSSGVTLLAQEEHGAVTWFGDLSFPARLANAVLAYATYLRESVWPFGLTCFHPHPALADPSFGPGSASVLLAFAVLLVATTLAVAWARRAPEGIVGWAWYLGTLVPVIGILQVGNQSHADRYAYLPLVGVYLAVVFVLARALRGHALAGRAAVGAAAAVLALLGLRTHDQVRVWRDSESLWTHALALDPDNWLASYDLGLFYQRAGRFEDAEERFRAALHARPDHLDAMYALGLVRLRAGDPAEAARLFQTVVDRRPGDADARSSLGLALKNQRLFHRAEEAYRAALALDPRLAEAHHGLGQVYLELERWDEAEAELRAALDLADDPLTRLVLGQVLHARGAHRAAVAEYRAGLAALSAPPPKAANDLAWILATSPDDAVRDGAEAKRIASAVVQATGERQSEALSTLAAACAELGELEAARGWQAKALERAALEDRAEMQNRLTRIEAGQPLRDGGAPR